jgi:glycosyltransferase involved in cell wall biosynthesis
MVHNSKVRLSVAIATLNEERNLPSCLESLKDLVDEVVIIDGGSTDKTVEIARNLGARVTVTNNPPIFHINKQKAIDQCKGEWILQLDADERITPELAEEIKNITSNQSVAADRQPVAFWIKRKKLFLGQWVKKGGHYPDPVIRLFKKGRAYLPCKSVHEQMVVNGPVGWLRNEMIHETTPSFTRYITKDNVYSSLMALELKEKRVPLNLRSLLKYFLVVPFKTWFDLFIRHKGFMDGFPGFVFAFYSAIGHFSAYVKYWEMEKTGVNSIEKDWKW